MTKRGWETSEGQVAAIDCKTVRRSADKAKDESPIHMAGGAGDRERRGARQVKTNDHSNEITSIPELIETLEVKSCVVTIDAMGCRKKIARQVVKRGADYVLAVKKNQPRL